VIDLLRSHKEVEGLFNAYKDPVTGYITAAEVKNFLEREQGEGKGVTLENCGKIINQLIFPADPSQSMRPLLQVGINKLDFC
jgi:hypothetical protein